MQHVAPATAPISPEPNVTPMIDVLLVMLVIFMAAIPAKRRALDAQLPPEETSGPTTSAGIVLEVGKGAVYAVNREPVPARDLSARLAAIYAGRPDRTIIVKGAPDARYQEVMTAADIARGAGVRVLGFDTRR